MSLQMLKEAKNNKWKNLKILVREVKTKNKNIFFLSAGLFQLAVSAKMWKEAKE